MSGAKRLYTAPGEIELENLAAAFPDGEVSGCYSQNYRLVDFKGQFDVYGVRVRLSVERGVSHVSAEGERVDEVYEKLKDGFPKLTKLAVGSRGVGHGGTGFGAR